MARPERLSGKCVHLDRLPHERLRLPLSIRLCETQVPRYSTLCEGDHLVMTSLEAIDRHYQAS